MSIFVTVSPVQGRCGAEAYPSSHYVRNGQFRIATLTNKDTFGLWEVPGENLCSYWENMETPRKAPAVWQVQTRNPHVVRRHC